MIDSATLTYAPFVDPRGKHNPDFTTGQSGKLLIGTDANGKKYLIKHCYPHNAANEFVGCWLAKKTGYSRSQCIFALPKQGLPKPVCCGN